MMMTIFAHAAGHQTRVSMRIAAARRERQKHNLMEITSFKESLLILNRGETVASSK